MDTWHRVSPRTRSTWTVCVNAHRSLRRAERVGGLVTWKSTMTALLLTTICTFGSYKLFTVAARASSDFVSAIAALMALCWFVVGILALLGRF